MDEERKRRHDGTAFGELLRAADSDAPPHMWEVAVRDTATGARRTFVAGDIMEARQMMRPREVMVSAIHGF